MINGKFCEGKAQSYVGEQGEWEVLLEADDLMEEKLPKKSMVKVGKLFTMHKGLVAARYGIVKDQKLREVLARLRRLFALEDPAKERDPSYPG